MRRSPDLQVEEISGNQYPDLKTVQDATLSQLANSLQSVIRDLLDRGDLVIKDGKIVPNPARQTV